ncbi:Anaphase promoting complex Cdc20 Cdh1 and Ama1 subunits protein [Dioscorea alata]|uniref:Anaphase promoting complex Cdc20 Cdh1 and Ama1 subunits protein n=1 Tax=Dioscorea alata TaxID=55571 RepID=A0ACB7VDK2_DIOAL|nr:Anaphase promoting complex Cdc20 Cdh1 and Ama1 subunits protein [Dioscorea alata]
MSASRALFGDPGRNRRREYDRFIHVMSRSDLDLANYWLMEAWKYENSTIESPYKRRLKECVFEGRTRVLSNNTPPQVHHDRLSLKPVNPKRQIPKAADFILDAPDILDDYYVNLLDWSRSNILAVALDKTVYLWNESDGSTTELSTFESSVTSVSWSHDGRRLAVGLHKAEVQLWDLESHCLFRKLQGVHNSRVGSIAWNNHILSTAGKKIVSYDTRAEPHAFQTCQGHRGRVCGLKWSPSGRQLASGGGDGLVHIWELSMASSQRWLHRFNSHKGSAKALCWSPVHSNLLASTGGDSDQCILVRNTSTCEVLSMVNTSCQISEILWSIDGKELLSSHGSYDNQLMLWNYPSMTKITDLPGHSSRILFMAQSSDGSTVATAGADEFLKIWKNVLPKHSTKTSQPFANVNLIR